MDLNKYKALFVAESREILENFQNELLKLERQEAGRDAIDAMFRAAHSLKGMAASMSYDSFADLAHAMEDLAGDARQAETLSTEAVDVLLEGVDLMSAAVDSVDSSDQCMCDSSQLIAQIRELHRRQSVAPAEVRDQATPPKTAPPEASTAPLSAEAKQIAVQFSEQSPAPQVRAFMLHRQLSEMTEVVGLEPSLEELKAGLFPERRLLLTLKPTEEELERVLKAAAEATDVESVENLGPVLRKTPVAPVEPEPAESQRTVRVRTEILDEFIDSVGELLRARDRLHVIAERLDMPELNDIADELVVLTKDLHERVMAARMTPLSLLTERLPRVVRDLSRRSGHGVELQVEGADIELDRVLLDELHSAILHIVRNAVDHGHEGVQARQSGGKGPLLSLVVRASRDRDHVLLEVEDDGGGMDPERLRQKAVTMGLLDPPRAQALSNEEALELICAPGFSTAAEVSEVSGRGVGMDAVLSTVEKLGGDLQIRSVVGEGTCFTLRLPLTMAIIGVMLVEHRGAVYAIPTNRISYARDFSPVFLIASLGEALLRVEDELLPFFDLGELLGHGDSRNVEEGIVVLFEDQAGTIAVRVDRIVGLQEVVVKPLGAPLSHLDFLSGAALLADGRPTYILDIGKLVKREAQAA